LVFKIFFITLRKIEFMESPKDELIEMYYRRIQAMTFKIEQLEKQLNYERKN
tara:strand:- start:27 stop:182 length:156 start_codon:yes stop_codon:yes gene_type:complete